MTTINQATQVNVGQVDNVKFVGADELRDLLVNRTLQGRGTTMVSVEYSTDPTTKMRAAGKAIYAGSRHLARKTVMVGYDYDATLQRRTAGAERATGGPTWQRAVVMGGAISAFTVHADDCVSDGAETTQLKSGARVYLRYALLTPAQEAAGFSKADYSRYIDAHGNPLDYDALKTYFYASKPGAAKVAHRTLGFSNVTAVKFEGITYRVTPA